LRIGAQAATALIRNSAWDRNIRGLDLPRFSSADNKRMIKLAQKTFLRSGQMGTFDVVC